MMPFTIALIGVGPMAALHAGVLAHVPGLRLVSCASRDLEKAEAFAAAHGGLRARRIEEVLARPDADALWVVAPADVMAPLTVEAARCGIPMFLEKPVGLSAKESRQVRDAVTVPHMVGLNRRFYEVIAEGRRLLAEAGGVRAIEVHMPEDMTRVPDKHAVRTRDQWQFANSIHLIDLFRLFAGEPTEITVRNRVGDRGDRSYGGLIGFAGGATGLYNAQWYAPGGWRVTAYSDDLAITYQPIERATLLRRGQEAAVLEPRNHDTRFKPGLFGQAEAFATLLRGKCLTEPAADLTDYARSVDLVDCLTRPGVVSRQDLSRPDTA